MPCSSDKKINILISGCLIKEAYVIKKHKMSF